MVKPNTSNKARTLTLPALELHQNGCRLIFTKMTPPQLEAFSTIEYFNSSLDLMDPAQGYQRKLEDIRIRQFAKWLDTEQHVRKSNVLMPTAILLSARDNDIVLSPNGTITLDSDHLLYLVDGQHRSKGFAEAISRGQVEAAKMELPIVIMLGLDKIEEMHQFQVVNSTQKSVRTDLANLILAQIYKDRGEEVLSDKDRTKAVVSQVVMLLNDDPKGPWNKRILMPDQSTETQIQTVRATSFMTSLRPIDNKLFDRRYDNTKVEKRIEVVHGIVDAFWRGVKSIDSLRECFKNPNDFVLLKTPGVFALHLVCRRLLDKVPASKRTTPNAYYDYLTESTRLVDPSFWSVEIRDDQGRVVQPRGRGADFGSMKGFSQLADLLLEEIDPENN